MPHRPLTHRHTGAPQLTLALLLAIALFALAGCGRLPGLSAAPTAAGLSPEATLSATPSPDGPAAPDETLPAPGGDEPTLTPQPLTLEESQATATGEAILHSVQTQFALLENPPTATPCDGPCRSATPTRTPYHTRTPTPTNTPSPPLAYLRILQPGPMSKVTSSIFLEASVISGANGVVRVELLGEDGRVLNRQVLRYGMAKGARFGMTAKIDFEIPSVAEAGRLQVNVEDAAGRPVALATVRLLLLSEGDKEVNPAPPPLEPYAVLSPKPEQTVSGGVVRVLGMARPVNSSPIVFELIDNQGAVLGSRQVQIDPEPDNAAVPFTAEIPYRVASSTPVRLIIHQADERIPGDAALSSLLLTLVP